MKAEGSLHGTLMSPVGAEQELGWIQDLSQSLVLQLSRGGGLSMVSHGRPHGSEVSDGQMVSWKAQGRLCGKGAHGYWLRR